MLDSCIHLIGSEVLRRNGASRGPVAAEGIGQRQVLADSGVGALGASGRLEHGNSLCGLPGESDGKAVIGSIDVVASRLEKAQSFGVLALGDLRQGALQDDLRLGRRKRQRIGIGGIRRSEAAGREIGIAKETANRRIARTCLDGLLGKVDRGSEIARLQGHLCPDPIGQVRVGGLYRRSAPE